MLPPNATPSGGHAVARSSELLSCARTALRITQQQHRKEQQNLPTSSEPSSLSLTTASASTILHIDPSSLTLHQNQQHNDPSNTVKNPAMEAVQHANVSLRLIDSTLTNLSSLVRRRGHTNDPTEEIHKAMSQFRLYATEIKDILEKTLKSAAIEDLIVGDATGDGIDGGGVGRRMKSSGQRVRHYEIVGLNLKDRVEERLELFKEVMAMREEVIKYLNRRRNELLENDSSKSGENGGSTIAGGSSTSIRKVGVVMPGLGHRISSSTLKPKVYSQLQSPLFTNNKLTKIRNGNEKASGNGMAQGATVGYGYGGGHSFRTTTGLRQRSTVSGGVSGTGTPSVSVTATNSYNGNDRFSQQYHEKEDFDDNNNKYTNQQSLLQIEKRQSMRRTKDRLQSARRAEAMLADLTSMFGKMSDLIHSQGDTLTKIEDDVEAAHDNVNAGVEEVGKLYEITKGNRSLIIKVFGILIFFVIAMRYF